MAAASYYHNIPNSSSQVDLSNVSRIPMSDPGLRPAQGLPSPPKSPLKPMFLGQTHPASPGYHNVGFEDELEVVQKTDEQLKRKIRTLRVISRTLSLLLAIAAFIPLALTLNKFLKTRNIYHQVGSVTRTAWAIKTKPWPTYMYFSISLTSVVINALILASYARSVKAANKTAVLGTIFSWGVLLADVGVWITAVIIYKYEKEVTENGKHNDLWGWTCSGAAKELQNVFQNEVPFDRYCNIQGAGWIAGLLQVGVLLMSAMVYWFVWQRGRTKKMVRASMRRSADRGLMGGFR